jgi:formamidopyrimidine-DNA glycosylase
MLHQPGIRGALPVPELPEVEVVRRGLAGHTLGRRVESVTVSHSRTMRRQPGGSAEFVAALTGRTITGSGRRGKFMWLTTDDPALVLTAHLGMSGQFRIDGDEHRHARVRFQLGGPEGSHQLWFVDQRTFGWLAAEAMCPGQLGRSGQAALVPTSVAAIAADLFDPDFDLPATVARMHSRAVAIKRQLLDQGVISGIGNIYADESLWRARIHPTTPGSRIPVPRLRALLRVASEVLQESLAAGGTSFDALYVNVNGESGYFGRGLDVYGRQGNPCPRCRTPIRREAFANRSSHYCPACQRPAAARGG